MMMCPHCGALVGLAGSLTVYHYWPVDEQRDCPGSFQNPRCAESDARPLWNGEANPHFAVAGSLPVNEAPQ